VAGVYNDGATGGHSDALLHDGVPPVKILEDVKEDTGVGE